MNIVKQLLCGLLSLSMITNISAQSDYQIEKLHAGINTDDYDEISPVVNLEGDRMFFTRVGYPEYKSTLIEKGKDLSKEMPKASFRDYLKGIFSTIAKRHITNPEQSSFNQDIWVAKSSSSVFDSIAHPEYPLNNALPNSVCSLTPSENEVILLNQFVEEGGMRKGFSVSRQYANGNWSFPEPITINNYHNSGPDVSMTMSQDGSVIILAMERSDSRGKTDLYISFRLSDQEWSTPKNMGSVINSSRRETNPFLSADNKSLFFSSNRMGSSGGSDLFVVYRDGKTWDDWSKPRRFVAPINSKSDESQPYFNVNTGYLYFTSKRDGSSDIFRVKIAPPNPIGVVVKGRVINAKTGKPIDAKVLSGMTQSKHRNIYFADDGSYRMTIRKGAEYTLVAEKPGFTAEPRTIAFKQSYVYYKEYKVDLKVHPIEEGSKIKLDPIFFEQSKAVVLKSSYPAVDKLADYLKKNTNFYIRIVGYTDNQGEKEALQKLSEERAEAIKEYLVYKRRINPVRIKTVGMGAENPLNDNSSDELRRQNRRVEAEITHISQIVMLEKE
ncbi:MAG: OmpA family protein [Bacteroidota bacterium]